MLQEAYDPLDQKYEPFAHSGPTEQSYEESTAGLMAMGFAITS